MNIVIDCPRSVVGYLSPDWKGQVSKQCTSVVGETVLMQTGLLLGFLSSGRLAEMLSKCFAKFPFW